MLNLERWVDPRVRLVQGAAVERYLQGHGWRKKPHAYPDRLAYEGPFTDDFGDPVVLLFSTEESEDFRQGIVRLITTLSVLEDRHPVEILNDLLHQDGSPASSPADGAAAGRSATAATSPPV
jgi:hypothetical protein